VIRRGVDQTDEPAIHREGVEPSGERLVIIVSFVKPGRLSDFPISNRRIADPPVLAYVNDI
jgi:hypothetical protein